MRRTKLVALATASLLSAAGTLSLATTTAGAAPGDTTGFADPGAPALGKVVSDVKTPKWREQYEARNKAALEKRVREGGSGDSVKLGKGKYGRVATAQQDKIFVVLAEFGDTQHSAYSGPARTARASVSWVRSTTRSPSRTGRPTTPRCGSRTTTTRTTRTCTSTG